MSDTAQQILIDELRCSLSELVHHYSGHEPVISTNEFTGLKAVHAASIGFEHDWFLGSVLLLSDATKVSQLGGPDDTDVTDWVGELGNQLIGRFKNNIGEYGALMMLGLPVAMPIEGLSALETNDGLWHIQWSACYLTAVLTMEVEPGTELIKHEDRATADEGMLLMF